MISVSTTTDDPAGGAAAAGDPVEPSTAVRELAAAAVTEEIGPGRMVGAYLGAVAEDEVAITVSFAATDPGYVGWQWSATVAVLPDQAPTVSEVVLLPGPQALLAPEWVPWEERVRPGDLGVGDLLPPSVTDPRLVPSYVASDDPEVDRVAQEIGLGREHVMSREGRDEAAERWHDGEFGPAAEMAVAAPAPCVSCGFYLPLAGSLGAEFGACGNEYSPADGRVVDSGYGCGAHSETVVAAPARWAADVVVDELALDVHARPEPDAAESAGDVQVAVDETGDEAGQEADPSADEIASPTDAAEAEQPAGIEHPAGIEPGDDRPGDH